ncbi:MAG: transglycosylase domain-containing protein [Pseudonocardia sp.]
MNEQSDPRLPTGRPAVPAGQAGRSAGHPPRPAGPRPPRPVPPQRYRPAGGDGASTSGPHAVHSHPRAPAAYGGSEMPLLTHDGPGDGSRAEEMARREASSHPEQPVARGRRGSPLWRTVRRWLLGTLAVLVLGPTIAFVVGYLVFDPPNGEVQVAQVATFTFADGAPLATVRPDNINRVTVSLDQVPEHVRQAVFAAEDRSFESNRGFDLTGIARAAWNQLQGGVGGGSTITQQYVKVATGDDSFSLWRKYKEVVLAVKVTRQQSKTQILENYLNLIYLGRGAYGIQAAAKVYFDKDVSQLSVSEGAMLAGIIQSPSRWDPAKNPAKSAERWNFVLDGMSSQGWLSPADRAVQQFPAYAAEPPPGGGIPGDDRGHLYNLAKAELEQYGITETMVNTQGLLIETTIDPVRQRHAVDAVTQVLKGQPENLRSALVSVDPKTGAIVAYYGGSNGVGTDYAQALRQPGSSFKPFVLAAALQGNDGVGLGTLYDGSSPQNFPGVGKPIKNNEGFDCAECSVKTAMTRSINTVFYRMALDVGPARVVDAAHAAGIPQDLLPQARGGIALGDQEVHPVDMASAFATFAADGKRRPPYLVRKVTAADGRVLHSRDDEPVAAEQVLPQQVARNVTEAMLDVAGVAGFGLGDRPAAAKTGTVQAEQAGLNKDAWAVGFTPQLSTAVWVGTDFSDPIKTSSGRSVFGATLPGPIWKAYMSDALRGERVEQFSRFVPLGDPPVNEFVDEDGEDGDEDGEDSGDGESRDGQDSRDGRSERDGNRNRDGNDRDGGNRDGGNRQNGGPDNGRSISDVLGPDGN